jgi:hypothetical protein
MMLVLLLTHASALALFWWLPGWAARRDAARFNANPASDDYHTVFHRQRLLERAGIFAAVVLLASLPVATSVVPFMVTGAGLLCAGAGIWAYRFNPLLNVARQLPYVLEYYVSPDPHAAWLPDRLLWGRATRAFPGPPDALTTANRQAYAARALRRLLAGALWAGLAGEAAGLAFLLC